MVEFLIQNGANVNENDFRYLTPLFLAGLFLLVKLRKPSCSIQDFVGSSLVLKLNFDKPPSVECV